MGIDELVGRDLFMVFERWEDREAEYFDRSREEYERFVRPTVCYEEFPDPEVMKHVNICYTEWFLFEFLLARGMTPLELFVDEPPAGVSEACLDRLDQVAVTEAFSRFAIREKHLPGDRVRLYDLRAMREVIVRLPVVNRRSTWDDGTLSLRVARVDDEWVGVGKTLFYDRSPLVDEMEPGPGERDACCILAQADEGWHYVHHAPSSSYYLNFVHELIGIDGSCADSFRIVG